MAHTKITSKYQATIPKEIRKALKLQVGDIIIFEVLDDGSIVLKKATPLDITFTKSLNSTLSEWNSENDQEDFSDLEDM